MSADAPKTLFPKWMNALPTLGAIAAVGGLVAVVTGFTYYATPEFWEVGYMPEQPGGGFNHQLHAGQLGMDCLYCHTHIDESPEANIPNVATCMGCHAEDRLSNWQYHDVGFVREAYAKDEPIPWARVHKLPDYVRNFPHHVHLKAGVSCFSCHGQIMGMPVVFQAHSLSMSWCLDCHRNPLPHLVPPDKVTDLAWVQEHLAERAKDGTTGVATAEALIESLHRAPPQTCFSCHH